MALPIVALQDPISGFTAAITSLGQLQVADATINVTATSVQLTSSSVTISGGSVVVTNGSVTIVAGAGALATQPVSNTSVAGSTAFVSVKVGAGRLFGLTVQASAGGIITVTDGSAGVPIFGLASTQTSIGPTYYGVSPAGNVFNTALVVVGTASSPAVTVHFS